MDIKLIALDMDGTLLNSEGKLSVRSQRTIEAAMKRGVHIVISTGRVLSALPKDVLAVPGIEYAVTSNGARIVYLKDKTTIYTNLIAEKQIEALSEYIQAEDLLLEIFFNGDVFIDKKCMAHLDDFALPQKYKDYVLKTRSTVEDIFETLQKHKGEIENINVNFCNLQRKEELWEQLRQIEGITITCSLGHNIEIGGATTSKADGIKQLCRRLDITEKQVMACGDNANDGAMLSVAGLAIAMGNAEEEVKKLAHFITKSNDDDGVAHAIEKFVLQV